MSDRSQVYSNCKQEPVKLLTLLKKEKTRLAQLPQHSRYVIHRTTVINRALKLLAPEGNAVNLLPGKSLDELSMLLGQLALDI